MKKKIYLPVVAAAVLFTGTFAIQSNEWDVECTEAQTECLRVKFGNEIHIFPGEQVEQQMN